MRAANGEVEDYRRIDILNLDHLQVRGSVVADMSHPRISERMEDLKMGKGPYFTFHRPYHLTSLEVPLTCARVATCR